MIQQIIPLRGRGRIIRFCLLTALLLLLGLQAVSAEDFSIDSYVIGGGGGSSSDTDYEVIGTIGQAVGGQIGDNSVSIQSGFWNDSSIDGAVFITWASGESFLWQVNDVHGTAGSDPGWTTTNIVGTLGITADNLNRFGILLKTLNGSAPGPAANWLNTDDYTWPIATASYAITGFAPDKFILNTNDFVNDAGRGGNFVIEQIGKSLVLKFNPLFAVADSRERPDGVGTKINLLDNDLLNGGAASIAGLDATSGAGGSLTQVGGFVFYTPPGSNPASDSFRYTLTDGNGHTANAAVIITVRGANNAQSSNIVGYNGVAGNFTITFAGIPGILYHIQWASTVTGPWSDFDAKTAASNGLFSVTDTVDRGGSAFYRTTYP
ncbi:MAG: putative surface-associated Ca2+-binding protein cadherin-like protein [Verrucomicrobiales bacterium]|nr:putative surface-associated Ca2+-binding protein cadherin-like protein [Verrucomicrobiales bacterium]